MDLPLPVAALVRRARNAKSPKERHDTAYFAWEASVRLAVAARPPADAAPLAMASVGQWVGALELDGALLAEPALLAAFALLSEVGLGKKASPRAVTARVLLDALPAYRNHVIGHGSTRAPEFYDEAAGALLGGLLAAWEAGVFWPRDGRLVYVDAVEIDSAGARRARTVALSGLNSAVEGPGAGPAVVPEDVLPKRLYLRSEGRHRPLHPWILFEEADLRERVLFFNGRGRGSRFLDYVSGEELKGKALAGAWPAIEGDLERLFARSSTSTSTTGGAAPSEKEAADPSRFGDYRLLGKLGQGGMGVVYLARQESLSRLVALKMLPLEAAADPVAVARFRREVAALTRCDHPNVVKILASGEAQGTHYYAMELVEGADLAQIATALSSADDFDTAVSSASERVRQARSEAFAHVPDLRASAPPAIAPALAPARSKDRPRRLAALFRDAARGVHHLHEAGIIHRDLKPGNLMVTAIDHRVVVMDLGLAALGDASKSITKDRSALLGTLRYMPPEQLQRNLLTLDRRADVYSLGATLYELVTDRKFLDGDSEARLIEQVLREEPLAPEKAKPGVPRDLSVIIRRATQKDPKLRYDSAEALGQDLDAFVEGRPIAARAPTLRYVAELAVRRNPGTAAAIAIAVFFAINSFVGTVLFLVNESVLRHDAERERKAAVEQARIAGEQREIAGEQARIAGEQKEIANAKTAEAERQTREARKQAFRAEVGRLELELQKLWDLRDREGETDAGKVVVAAAEFHAQALAVSRTARPEGLEPANAADLDPSRTRLEEVCTSVKVVAHRAASPLVTMHRPAVIGGPAAPPVSACLSPDGSEIAAGVGPYVVIWSRESGAPARVLVGHAGDVSACAFSPDGREILSASQDMTLRLSDRASGRLIRGFEGHTEVVLVCAFSPDGREVLSASQDKTLRLWDRASGGLIRSFEGHTKSVNACAFSPDGREILSASEDKTLRLWDRASGGLIRSFEGHTKSVNACAFSPDGREILSASHDRSLRLWDRASGGLIRSFGGHGSFVNACAFSPDGREVLSASEDKTLRLWDRASGRLTRCFEGHAGGVWSCAISPDGREVLSASGDTTLRLWDRASGRLIRSFEGHHRLDACAYSPDGREVLSASGDTTLRLWDRASGRLIRSFDGHAGALYACAFSPDGREILSASADKTLRLWDRASGRLIVRFEGHTGGVQACAFSPDGREVLSASRDTTLRLWDRASGRLIRSFDGHAGALYACAFSPDGREVLSASADKTLRLWDRASGRLTVSFEGHTGDVLACAFSPDGREVLSASKDKTLQLWDRASGRFIRSFEGHAEGVSACAFSPDGREVLSASLDRSLRLWDRASGRPIRSFEGHTNLVLACAFSPDGREVLSASWDETLRFWYRASGRLIRSFEGHASALCACAFSPDGREVLSASEDSTLRLWDHASGRLLRSFEGHTGDVLACAFSPDGREVLSASEDSTLRLWDHASGRLLRRFEGHTGDVQACAFSPDGREVLSASRDKTLRLWDRASGRLIRSFEGHTDVVAACALSPDGREVLSASNDKSLRLWDRASGRFIRSFEGHTHRVLGCAFSPDGREVLSASNDRSLRLWDRASGRFIRSFEGHADVVAACAFSPDGRQVLSASSDKTLRLWDRASGRLIRSFDGHADGVSACAFSPDGRKILSASWDNTLRLWDTGPSLAFDEVFPGFDHDPVAAAKQTVANLRFHAWPIAPAPGELPALVPVPGPAAPSPPLDLSTADALCARGLDLMLAHSAPAPGAQSGRAYLAAAADQGHLRAALRLAWSLERGLGGPCDLEEAKRIRAQAATYTATADADDPLAKVLRALAAKDLPLLRKAAERNEPDALLALADLVPNVEAAAFIERAAMIGDPEGILRRGERTAKEDPLAAMDDYERAAGLGLERAFEVLARVYDEGIGVARDTERSVRLRSGHNDGPGGARGPIASVACEVAVGALRTLTAAQARFRELDMDGDRVLSYAKSLEALGKAQLVHEVLALGLSPGYALKIIKADDSTWSCAASPVEPGKSGDHYLFVDQSGVIRFSTTGQATALDSAIGGR